MTRRKISDETKQLIDKLYDENLSVREIARRMNVSYTTAYGYTRLRQNINPETGKPFESLSQYRKYLSKQKPQHPTNQAVSSEQPINQEQQDVEAPLIAALWSLEDIKPPTKIGYNDFGALIALAQYYWGEPVFPSNISEALNASKLTPDDARLQPQGLEAYFEKLKQLRLIQGTSESGYTMDRGLARIIFDNFDRFVTPGVSKERFWGSVEAWYRLV